MIRVTGLLEKNDLKRIWKEAALTYLAYCNDIVSGGTAKTPKSLVRPACVPKGFEPNTSLINQNLYRLSHRARYCPFCY
jgi:hypothetical protein